MLSQHNCDFCQKRMSTHLIETTQIESCFTCQQIWLDAGELQKLHITFKKALGGKKLDISGLHPKSAYSMTQNVAQLDFIHFGHRPTGIPVVVNYAELHRKKWLLYVFISESIINIFYIPGRYMIKNHPIISALILVAGFIAAKRYLLNSEVPHLNWDFDIISMMKKRNLL
jgi:Zn-finger nucleic acid-binding protein